MLLESYESYLIAACKVSAVVSQEISSVPFAKDAGYSGLLAPESEFIKAAPFSAPAVKNQVQ